jgi:hypothetical protein
LKNSFHGQIWSDFEKVSLKMLAKTWFFSKWVKTKFQVGKYSSYQGKTKITNFNFLMNFVRARPRARAKNVSLRLPFKKVLPAKANKYYENLSPIAWFYDKKVRFSIFHLPSAVWKYSLPYKSLEFYGLYAMINNANHLLD